MKLIKKQLPKQEIIIFARQLSLILDSEVSLYEGLSIIKDKCDHKDLENVLDQMIEEVKFGKSLSEILQAHEVFFSEFFVHMIELGEASGDIVDALNQIADTFEKELETTEKIKSAVTYPIILAILMTAVVGLLIVEILPIFDSLLKSLGGEMPAFTKSLMNLGLAVRNYAWHITLSILVVISGLLYYKGTENGSYFFDRLKFKMPIQGPIVSSITAVRFARNLAILIRSGIPVSIGIRMLKSVINNQYVSKELDAVSNALDEGGNIDEEFAKLDLFPWVLIKLFSVAQTTGHMDHMLDKAADVMEKETDVHLDQLTTIIEPLLILILSVIVGVILISVILPIVNIMQSIG